MMGPSPFPPLPAPALSQGKKAAKQIADLQKTVLKLERAHRSQSSTETMIVQTGPNPIASALAGVSEHLARAEQALQAAQRVAQAAAQSFANEQANVATARRELDSYARTLH